MKAVLQKAAGAADTLFLGETDTPVPGEHEILVEVHAAGVNRADIMQREGNYPPPAGASAILGLEAAGTVAAVGTACHRFKKGQRVFALLAGGGYSEYAAVNEDHAMPIPDSLSFEEAAALPEAFLTAYQALAWIGRLEKSEAALVHAGASGVGTAAIQIARELGARVFATAGTGDKCERCMALGAEEAWNYHTAGFAEKSLAATEGAGVDVILDFIGASYLSDNLRCVARDGRIVLISTLGGSVVSNFNLGAMLGKRVQLTGTTLRSRSSDYKARLIAEFSEFALPRLERHSLVPVIDSSFPIARVSDAHRRMEGNLNIGKLVLQVR